jgi:hypothetical protein
LKTAKVNKSKKMPEFRKGGKAKKAFEETMRILFQVPKSDSSKKPKKGKD